MAESETITQLLERHRTGDRAALDEVVTRVYGELRRLAQFHLARERPDHTLQATALVNEAYVRLARDQGGSLSDRAHFFAVAARVMRNVLVDHARARRAGKRGGGADAVDLDDVRIAVAEHDTDVIALDAALDRLARVDEQQAKIVELRYFAGMSVEETAELLGVSTPTVKRDWAVAKAWMQRELTRAGGPESAPEAGEFPERAPDA